MTFGLKNAGATYQRAMNYIFHKLIGRIVEINIDDVVIKSLNHDTHLEDVKRTLECTRKHGVKMNPNKCAFGVSAGEFLGFLVHEGGIEVGKKSMKAIAEVVPPTNLKELQSLLGKINFVRRFISNLSQRVLPFSPLLKLKKDHKFMWGDEQQKAFDEKLCLCVYYSCTKFWHYLLNVECAVYSKFDVIKHMLLKGQDVD
jgi:hypothetical protein